jgi:uridine kinase
VPARRLDPAALAALLPTCPPVRPGRWVLAIEGRSGAGKTTLAADVADRLRAAGFTVTVVSMDELYPGWDGLEAAVDLLRDGVLAPFAAGADAVSLPRWDWAGERAGVVETRPAAQVLVVEGTGCGARACAPYLSLLVWVDAPDAVRRARALARDAGTYAPHWDRWERQESAHYDRERTDARAQAVVAVP